MLRAQPDTVETKAVGKVAFGGGTGARHNWVSD